MKSLRTLLGLLIFGSTIAAVQGASGPSVSEPHVVVRMIADVDTVAPGQTFRLGVHYRTDEHWHIYWKNPGDTGITTSIDWQIPEGFTVGALQWPTPKRFTMFELMNYVHEGDVVLFAAVTAPDNLTSDTELKFAARTDWLICEDVCIPGSADLTLTLNTGAESKPAETDIAELFQQAVAQLPARNSEQYQLAAFDNGQTIQLLLQAQDGGTLPTEDSEIYFFEDDTYNLDTDGEPFPPNIDTNVAQTVTRIDDSQFILTLTKSDYAEENIAKIGGVFAASAAWEGSPKAGIELSATLAPGPAPIGGTQPTSENTAGNWVILGKLAGGFIGGLILNLMPCVFPVLGLKIMSFVSQAGGDRKKIVLHGWVFAAGVLLSLWVLGGVFLGLRAAGEEIGWGFQLQNPIVVYLTAAILLIFGLNLSGVFEIGTSAVGVGQNLTSQSGLKGSFFSGVLATVVATPCTAPFLGSALGATATLSAFEGMLIFTALGAGLAFPYLFFSIQPNLLNKLPRPGAWMESFKQAMAFLLYGSAGYLVWVLSTQLIGSPSYDDQALLYSLSGLTIAALACWIFGRWAVPSAGRKTKLIGTSLAALGLVGGLWAGAPRASNLVWDKWEPGLAEELAAEGKRVYVDFTASWCFTCQVNKRVVFGNDAVIESVLDEEIVLLKADWTHHDERITDALAGFQRNAIPFNLVYGPGLDIPKILPEILTPGLVMDALVEAR